MDRDERFVSNETVWRCPGCVFFSSLDQEMAQHVHRLTSPQCSSGLMLVTTQQVGSGSASGSGHLESDDVMPAARLGQHHEISSMQPFAPYPQGGACASALWPTASSSSDALQRTAESLRHLSPFPQQRGYEQQLESDDAINRPDYSREREIREPAYRQQIEFGIDQAKAVLGGLQCAVCFMKWRSIATTRCRHLVSCDVCIPQLKGTCPVCRQPVESSFPVKLHSSTLLEGLDVLYPLAGRIGEKTMQRFLSMGFPVNRIRRAIHLVLLQNNSEALSDPNLVLSLMDADSKPSAEEIELLLENRNLDDTVKRRLFDYLEAISKCMVCGQNLSVIRLMPCNHLALCIECLHRQPVPTICPDCQAPIDNHVFVFLA